MLLGEFVVNNPMLRWPKELGDQPLYEVIMTLTPLLGEPEYKTSQLGIRKV